MSKCKYRERNLVFIKCKLFILDGIIKIIKIGKCLITYIFLTNILIIYVLWYFYLLRYMNKF